MARRDQEGTACQQPKPASPPENAGRYLTRLCQHASKMNGPMRHRPRSHAGGGAAPEVRQAECSDTHGMLRPQLGAVHHAGRPGHC